MKALYAFKHRPTGYLYIGSTTNLTLRRRQWELALQHGRTPSRFKHLTVTPSEIDFIVITEFRSMEPDEVIRKAEQEAIEFAARTVPDKLLNLCYTKQKYEPSLHGVPRSTYYARRRAGMTHEQAIQEPRKRGITSALTILDDESQPIPHSTAAAILKCTEATLQRRLKKRRGRGDTTVLLSDLQRASEQARFYQQSGKSGAKI